jgi:hypothetical protein
VAPPLLKCQKSTLLNKFLESDFVPSAQAQVLPNKPCGDENVPQPKASSDQNIPQQQQATFEIAKCFINATIFTNNPQAILSDNQYLLVEAPWK